MHLRASINCVHLATFQTTGKMSFHLKLPSADLAEYVPARYADLQAGMSKERVLSVEEDRKKEDERMNKF